MQVQLFEQSRRACVAQRNVLHTHETAIGHAILRKVVGVICFLNVLFAHFGDEFLRWQRGNIRAQLVARVEPAVVILLREDVEVGKVGVESWVEPDLVACLHGEKERQLPRA